METQAKYEDILEELRDMPTEQMLNLLNLIRLFKKSINMQREFDFYLNKEFEEWDALSDEALNNFEVAL